MTNNLSRRSILEALGAAVIAPKLMGTTTFMNSAPAKNRSSRGVTDTSNSPNVKLRSIDMNSARWTRGFWADRFSLAHNVMIQKMWNVMNLPNNGCTFVTFRIVAGGPWVEYRVTPYSDGDFYKWLEAAAHAYALTEDPTLDRMMDDAIEVVAKAQAHDGYISTPVQIRNGKRWETIMNHELYNMGHLMTAACIHFRATGKDTLLEVATKCADYLYVTFSPRPPELAHFCFNPSQIMGLVEMYRTTGNRNYLSLAQIFVANRGSQPGGTDQNQDRTPFPKSDQAVGHAVTGTYLYAGAADIEAESHDLEVREALDRLWDDVEFRKCYVTGAIGALHTGFSNSRPGFGDQVHEAFGAPYELPNRTAYNETCANIANAMWNWRMLSLTGEARYADMMERVFYNSMLSGVSLAGTKYFYTNVLSRDTTMPLLWSDSSERWENTTERWAKGNAAFCCPPNVLRTYTSMHEYAYSLSEKAVWVNFYGSNELKTSFQDGRTIELTQTTDYPWDGKITLVTGMSTEGSFSLRLRIPAWCTGAAIRINGASVTSKPEPGSYAEINRLWKPGDRIELDLPMKALLITGNPKVEEICGQVAVMRGPIVYCIESADLPEGVAVRDLAFSSESLISERFEADLLGGVVTVLAKAHIRRASASSSLYEQISAQPANSVTVRMIPYYAWSNRGLTSMTVWLPLRA